MSSDVVPGVSVIISNLNGAKYLPRLLETLHAQRGIALQIIVVDRQSTDASASILAAHPEVVVVTEPPQSGLVSGYHAGVERATHPMLFFCNEDMWFEPDCLERLVAMMRSAPDIAVVDPWQWTYDGATVMHAGTRFVPVRLCQTSPDVRRNFDFYQPLEPGAAVPFACAAAMLVRRDVYDAVGGWDRGFFLDLEDLDLCLRVWQAGWRVVLEPRAKVYHAVGGSNPLSAPGTVIVGRRRYVSGRSNVLVIALKHLPWSRVCLAAAVWWAAAFARLLRGRWSQFAWDLSAAREVFGRSGAALRFRRANGDGRRRLPAMTYFRRQDFQR